MWTKNIYISNMFLVSLFSWDSEGIYRMNIFVDYGEREIHGGGVWLIVFRLLDGLFILFIDLLIDWFYFCTCVFVWCSFVICFSVFVLEFNFGTAWRLPCWILDALNIFHSITLTVGWKILWNAWNAWNAVHQVLAAIV